MAQSDLPVTPGAGANVATDDIAWDATTCKAQMVKLLDGTAGSTRVVNAAITPAAGALDAVATGGTAVTAISGPVNGGFIVNPATAAGQSLTGAPENLYLDMVGAPGSTDAAAFGTTLTLYPGDRFDLPYAIATGVSVKVNAATSGHTFTSVQW
jgi:hypothetical protein